MVTGPWGVGKTFQVKEAIQEDNQYYVSLYGLESVAAINDAVLAACLPGMKASEHLTTVSEVGKAMGDKFALAGFANTIWTAFLKTKLTPDRILIFDDLERSTLWASSDKSVLLGAINQYVEHGGFRVVVICHDEKVAEEIAKLKEKTFGHTVKVEPQTDRALEQFLDEQPQPDVKAFLLGKRALISEIWTQSGQSSLRILKHIVSDIGRLFEILEERHNNRPEAIDHLIRFFAALDIEIRAGQQDPTLLFGRKNQYVSEMLNRGNEGSNQPISELHARYPSADITGQILSDDLIREMLIEGQFNDQKLAEWLDQTPYFLKPEEAAPWQIVIGFDEHEEDVLSRGIELMQAQFEERSVTTMGEFFHIAALRLMMTERGALPHGAATEEKLCIEYIEDLLEQGLLPPKPLEYDSADRAFQSYGGHVYWGVERSPELKRVIEYWKESASKVRDDKLPEHAAKVLEILRTSPLDIFKTISRTNYHYNPLSHTPILQHISPKDFIDAWLSGPRSGWRETTMALDNRYDHRALEGDLKDERTWLAQLGAELDERIVAAKGLAKFRLERIKPKVHYEVQKTTDENGRTSDHPDQAPAQVTDPLRG